MKTKDNLQTAYLALERLGFRRAEPDVVSRNLGDGGGIYKRVDCFSVMLDFDRGDLFISIKPRSGIGVLWWYDVTVLLQEMEAMGCGVVRVKELSPENIDLFISVNVGLLIKYSHNIGFPLLGGRAVWKGDLK